MTRASISPSQPLLSGPENHLEPVMLRVRPTGAKLWLLNYTRPFTGKRTNIGLGAYPEVSLADAREKRDQARKLLAKDIDPREKREEEHRKQAVAHNSTLKHVATEWLKVKRKSVSDDYADDIWRSFELHIFPELGSRPLHKVTAPLAINAIKPLAAKGSLSQVRRVCRRVNELMIWAVNTGVIPHNPLAGIKEAFEAPEKRNQPTIEPDQLGQFLADLQEANVRTTTRCLILWQLHTMVRPSEAAGARWDEIDVEAGVWTIPAERMKKSREHRVPLTPQAMHILERMKPISDRSKCIFPADRDRTKPANPSSANMAIKRMANYRYKGTLVAHGMRSIASTVLNSAEKNEQGDRLFEEDIVEAALGHFGADKTAAAYNRGDYLERRRGMMLWWSDHIGRASGIC